MVGRVATLTVKSGALKCELAVDGRRERVTATSAALASDMRPRPTITRRCWAEHRRCRRVRWHNDSISVQRLFHCDPDEPPACSASSVAVSDDVWISVTSFCTTSLVISIQHQQDDPPDDRHNMRVSLRFQDYTISLVCANHFAVVFTVIHFKKRKALLKTRPRSKNDVRNTT